MREGIKKALYRVGLGLNIALLLAGGTMLILGHWLGIWMIVVSIFGIVASLSKLKEKPVVKDKQ